MRVFRRHATLQGGAGGGYLGLRRDDGPRFADFLPLGDPDLRLHDVDPCDLLGHGVLHLHAGVDLDEIEGLVDGVVEELHGGGVVDPGLPAQPHRRLADLRAFLQRQVQRRGPFDDLLVPALQGAIPFKKMQHIAVVIAKNLRFYVQRVFHQFFQEHFVVAEIGGGLVAPALHRVVQFLRLPDDAHAAPAAAPAGFQHQRIPDGLGDPRHRLLALGQGPGGRHHRHFRGASDLSSLHLVAQIPQHARGGPDKRDAAGLALFGEVGVLRQKAVARMNGVALGLSRHPQDVGAVQIRLNGPVAHPHLVGLIRFEAVQGQPVFFRENPHRAKPQLPRRPNDANGDLAAVGHQDLVEVILAQRQSLHAGAQSKIALG